MRAYKVGDVVFVRLGWGAPCEVTITAIGRRWVTFDGDEGRFDKDTGELDGGKKGWSPGAVYASRAEWEAEQVWSALQDAIRGRPAPPEGVTAGAIEQAMALLGLVKSPSE